MNNPIVQSLVETNLKDRQPFGDPDANFAAGEMANGSDVDDGTPLPAGIR
jgi:hypothetical protein